jgi:hypothetical protein
MLWLAWTVILLFRIFEWLERQVLRWSFTNFSPSLALNHNPPDLFFLSSWDYRCEPPCLVVLYFYWAAHLGMKCEL